MRCDFHYPGNFYRIVHGGTGLEGRIRSVADSETYCLKIIQLLLPVNGHGIRPLEKLIYAYNEYVPCVNENWTAYIGIVGAVGFYSCWYGFYKKKERKHAYKAPDSTCRPQYLRDSAGNNGWFRFYHIYDGH